MKRAASPIPPSDMPLAVVLLWVGLATPVPEPGVLVDARVRNIFSSWRTQFEKSYSSGNEEKAALQKFAANEARVRAHNAGNHAYKLGLNQFSDLTQEEFSNRYATGLLGPTHPTKPACGPPPNVTHGPTPQSVDWAKAGKVTSVKDQKECGGCWAFAVSAVTESAYAIANDLSNNELVSLSAQDLLDCDFVDYGCSGGWPQFGMKFVHDKGLCSWDDYPFTGKSAPTCQTSCKPVVSVQSCQNLPVNDEEALLKFVAQRPIYVGVAASDPNFHNYKSGVLTDCGKRRDHAVTIVGYGHDDESGLDYWKIKNSWGDWWGENGYIRIQRGIDLCGVSGDTAWVSGAEIAPPRSPAPPPSPPPAPPSPPRPPVGPGYERYGDPKIGCLPDEVRVVPAVASYCLHGATVNAGRATSLYC